MITISLCMIVRDEGETLPRCLDSIQDIVDEIVIIDTGSKDRTREIASQYTSNIFEFQWIDDFSAARNYSFSKATMDYILWLDADDVILNEDRIKLKMMKEQMDSSMDIVMFKYNLGIDDKGRPTCTYYRERLLKRSCGYIWNDPVHEYIIPTGRIATADIAITHMKTRHSFHRNLGIFQKIIMEGKELSHRNYFYYARELNLCGYAEEAKVYYEKFLNQEGGLFSNYMDACIDLSRIYTREGDRKNAIRSLFRCFEYGIPRGEICCELGGQYKELNNLERAIYWYDVATRLVKPDNTLGAVIHDCYNYIPYAEMSACYFKLGLMQEAVKYNEKASEFKPDSSLVINNRRYFDTLIKNAKTMP